MIEDALEDGWNRGKKEGKEEGIKEGIKENKLSFAKRMLEKKHWYKCNIRMYRFKWKRDKNSLNN